MNGNGYQKAEQVVIPADFARLLQFTEAEGTNRQEEEHRPEAKIAGAERHGTLEHAAPAFGNGKGFRRHRIQDRAGRRPILASDRRLGYSEHEFRETPHNLCQ